MIHFPVLRKLEIENYGLFPGRNQDGRFLIQFDRGPTLIIGINGLGKTTLISILLRMLTGPFDLSRRGSGEQLGEGSSSVFRLGDPRIFAHRVADGAENATAKLTVSFGTEEAIITRSLKNLSLTGFLINGKPQSTTDETEDYHPVISKLLGVSSFYDAVLLLRHLVFYLEDRRNLVWDETAQRQLLRLLFLEPSDAFNWSEIAGRIGSADSSARNLNTIIQRRRRQLAEELAKLSGVTDTRAQLAGETSALEAVTQNRSRLLTHQAEAEERRKDARLRLMRGREEKDRVMRSIEQVKFNAISASFPSADETAQYILTRIFADETCIVCGTRVSAVARELEAKLEAGNCVICSTPREQQENVVPEEKVNLRRLNRQRANLQRANSSIATAENDQAESEEQLRQLARNIQAETEEIVTRDARIRYLEQQLPHDERTVSDQERQLQAFEAQRAIHIAERTVAEEEFEQLFAQVNDLFRQHQDAISNKFSDFARYFLIEACELSYEPKRARFGQSGEFFDFPRYVLQMSGSAVSGLTLREGPDQVSESQREFIDLAYRMALINQAADGGSTTLIMDAPESSLDIIFDERAGLLLAQFGLENRNPGNRVVLASNLSGSHLIPSILRALPADDNREGRLVNLLDEAAPNAALQEHREEYRKHLTVLLEEFAKEPRS